MKKKPSAFLQEPIAIVGIGCRFPGGIISPDSFWEFLCREGDGICDTPSSRWSLKHFFDEKREKKGKLYVKKGGFLDEVDKFDPLFFGISPKEAHFMDPQQRLLLEVTWESLENAGIIPTTLSGTKTGVYVGLFIHDYENMHSAITEYQNHGVYSATGGSATIAANRISYQFDLKGPSLIIDTACSSSLVGIHYACRDLWNREADLALAAGVNLMLKPELSMSLCKASMLSPDGYCKTFDANANGYARAEGVATIVLKRLSEAENSGDCIYAVIRGTALNQDGRGQGLTVPNGNSQEELILNALKNSGVDPGDVQYVEAHGTGTEVGDPIEAGSLGKVLAKGRTGQDYCTIGSVKSNFGHTEAAAGVAGLIKTALMLKNKQIPPNLHFKNPNPRIDFDALMLKVPVNLESWPKNENKPRLACVNSFGFGGTNAHAILQEYEPTLVNDSKEKSENKKSLEVSFIPLSAKTEKALDDTVIGLLSHLKSKMKKGNSPKLSDIGYTTAHHKAHHSQRLCVIATSQEELIFKLEQHLKVENSQGIARGSRKKEDSLKSVFVFSGMGQQWIGMGCDLARNEPIVQTTIEECDALFRRFETNWSLIDQLTRKDKLSRIHETQVAQPCIFALQVALAKLWNDRGVFPKAVVGHSVGEIAACHVAGVLSLDDAVMIAFHRSRLQQMTSGKGGMLAVGMSHEDIIKLLMDFETNISVGAINSPTSVTLSGDIAELNKVAFVLDKNDVFNRFLKVEVPYHSPVMDLITSDLEFSLTGLKPKAGKIPLISTVTGEFIDGSKIDASYWVKNVRQPVLFAKAFKTLVESNHSVFLEIGAHPVLMPSIKENLDEKQKTGIIFHSIKRDFGYSQNILKSIAELYVNGYPIQWKQIYPKGSGRLIALPNYPFQRKRYWNESRKSEFFRTGKDSHPVLGIKTDSGLPSWIKTLDLNGAEFLGDHAVQNEIVYPATAYIEMIRSAMVEEYQSKGIVIEDLELTSPLILDPEIQTSINLTLESNWRVSIHSKKSNESDNWIQNASGKATNDIDFGEIPILDIDHLKQVLPDCLEKDEVYQHLTQRGLTYGSGFQLVQEMWRNNDSGLGKIAIVAESKSETSDFKNRVTLLDACFHILELIPNQGLYLPTRFKKIYLNSEFTSNNWAFCKITHRSLHTIEADIWLYCKSGKMIAYFQQASFARVDLVKQRPFQSIEKNLFNYHWQLQKNTKFIHDETDSFHLADLSSLNIEMQSRFDQLSNEFGVEKLGQVIEKRLDDLCLQYIINMFYELGIPIKQGFAFISEEIIQNNGITDHYTQLFLHLVTVLEKQGILLRRNDHWEVGINLPSAGTDQTWSSLLAKYPILQAELFLLFKCGTNLFDILTGKQSPLNIIYSSESTFVEHLYQHSPVIRIYNTILKKVVLDAVKAADNNRNLKILEIGAGTGSLTSYLLQELPADRIKYTYTDITSHLLTQAKEKFSNYAYVDYRTLDITKSPEAQGFGKGSFDIIVSSLTLHATPDLKESVRNIKELLSSNGMLVILEITKNPFWLDVIFGTLKGWWSFTDFDLRPNHPIINTISWNSLLSQEGFTEVAILKDQNDRYVEHGIIIANNQSETISDSIPIAAHNKIIEPVMNDFVSFPWIIVNEGTETARYLIKNLAEKSLNPIEVRAGTVNNKADNFFELNLLELEQLMNFFEHLSKSKIQAPNVIFLPGDYTVDQDDAAFDLEETTNHFCQKFLHLIQALMQQVWDSYPKFWLITQGSQTLKNVNDINLVQTPLWGMRRVAANEYPGLDSWAIDLSRQSDSEELDLLINEILHSGNYDEIALRGGKRYVNRLISHIPESPVISSSKNFHLIKNSLKQLNDPIYQADEIKEPAPDEVQVRVISASLNKNDLSYPESNKPYQSNWAGYGVEFSGIINKVGSEINLCKPGQEVFGVCSNACSSMVNIKSNQIAIKPENLSFFAACSIPLSFICANHILKYKIPIENIKTILIQNATDEIGLAFLQLLAPFSVRIFATANTPEKLDYLKTFGIVNVGLIGDDSLLKSLANNGEGIALDAIINLSEKQLGQAELNLLTPFRGHVVEIPQSHPNISTSLADLPEGVSFHVINPVSLVESISSEIGSELEHISGKIYSEEIHPFPFRLYNFNEPQSAIDYLKNPNRIGKTCLLMNDYPVNFLPATSPIKIDKEKAYLIAGGLNGFGLATANWLVSNGAKFLILISRQGPNNKDCLDQIRKMESQGVRIIAESVDIADEMSVKRLFQRIASESISLGGIIHSAMVLDIALMAKMNSVQMKKVLHPKVPGTWNLYKYSRQYLLDFFIFYSSLTATLGFSGQANYAAGNSFCNAMAHYMRMQGIKAHSFCWGLIEEAGWVARHDEARESVKQSGFYTQSLDQVWRTIQYGLSNDIIELNASPINWSIAKNYMSTLSKTPRLSHFLERVSTEPAMSDNETNSSGIQVDLLNELTIESIIAKLMDDLSQSLGLEKENIGKNNTLGSLNFDSLIAVELGLKIKQKFKIDLPKVILLQENLLIEELGETIHKEIQRQCSGEEIKRGEESVHLQSRIKIDLLAETSLPDDIVPSSQCIDIRKEPSRVLLTGATGFLGAYLIHELIQDTKSEVVCLVRPAPSTPIEDRVYNNLARYGLWREGYKGRIKIVKGDLSQPGLGLTKTIWDELSHTIEIIYHNGSWLNFAQPYSVLKPANVEGTKEMLRLACEHTTKPFHYVSTLIKISQTAADPDRIARQGFSHNEPTAYDSGYIRRNGFNIGYHQSKWVAEELVLEAESRGLPTTIYRPTLIAADSKTGLWNENDYISRLLKGCMEIGKAPQQDLYFDFCPVDYISEAIVYLSQQSSSLGNNFLLKNPDPIKWNNLILWLSDNVYKMDLVSPDQWLKSVQCHIEKNVNSPLYSLLPLFEIRPFERLIIGSPPYILSPAIIENNVTRQALKPSIICPQVDDRLLKKYFQNFF